jgi:hypothetical protein
VTAPLEFEEAEGRELEGALSGFSSEPPLVCFPLRIDWENAQRPRAQMSPQEAWLAGEEVEGKAPHPEPEVVGGWRTDSAHRVSWGLKPLEGEGVEVYPAPVLKLAEHARETSWEVRMRYTRGHGMHATQGKPIALRHMIALAFGRHPMTDRQAVAVYEKPVSGGTWSWSTWVMGPDLPACGALLLAELEEFLAEPQLPVEWFAEKRRGAERKAREAKERAKARPKKARAVEAL